MTVKTEDSQKFGGCPSSSPWYAPSMPLNHHWVPVYSILTS